jgi:hypothetical protein
VLTSTTVEVYYLITLRNHTYVQYSAYCTLLPNLRLFYGVVSLYVILGYVEISQILPTISNRVLVEQPYVLRYELHHIQLL